MALGLVIATIIGVAFTGHAIVPGMRWVVAFTLGGIVAPTDEIALLPTLERLSVPRRTTAIIEGERSPLAANRMKTRWRRADSNRRPPECDSSVLLATPYFSRLHGSLLMTR